MEIGQGISCQTSRLDLHTNIKYTAFVLERRGLSFTWKNKEKVRSLPALILEEFTHDGGVGP